MRPDLGESGAAGVGHGADEVVDIVLDIDAGLGHELFLALLGHRDDALEPLTKLGVHDGPDVGVGDDGGISRYVGQLGRPGRGGKCLETTAVERDESGAEPGRDDRRGTCHEVTGLFGHARFAPLAIITGLRPAKVPLFVT